MPLYCMTGPQRLTRGIYFCLCLLQGKEDDDPGCTDLWGFYYTDFLDIEGAAALDWYFYAIVKPKMAAQQANRDQHVVCYTCSPFTLHDHIQIVCSFLFSGLLYRQLSWTQ